ncbi:hypothetical protein KX816_18940 [Sphingosinicellaceae bacterium]|nr:hypothetical protein KX816_18940 [Sphingosinicellaceae bacterium]
MSGAAKPRLGLFGPFRLTSATGQRIEVPSRKGIALLAMLATSPDGERSRGWLQDRLWGSREREQSQSSLRRELSQVRRILDDHGLALIETTGDRVRLRLDAIELMPASASDFLEGIDLRGEEVFEEWLREQRRATVVPKSPPTPFPKPALTPGRPASLAILGFENQTGDPDADYLAEGIGEELIDRVSRLRWLPVISPGPGPAPKAGLLESGRTLGAAYILGGRLRRVDHGYWLSGQVINVATGELVWSPRLRLPAPQASGALASLVAELVAVLENRVADFEGVRALAVPEVELSVADLVWRGRWHQDRLSHHDTETAGKLLKRALELAPNWSVAVLEYARHLALRAWNRRLTGESVEEIRALAQRAVVLDYEDARGHMLVGASEMWRRQPIPAEMSLLRAVDLNPSLGIAWDQLGTLRILTGRPDAALEPLATAMRLAPLDYRQFYKQGEVAMAQLMLGELDQALAAADRSINLRPGYWYAHVCKINALARSGKPADARRAWKDLQHNRPGFETSYIDWIPFSDPKWRECLKTGIDAAADT